MAQARILFDLTRLKNRAHHTTPTGIDRVLLNYAKWLTETNLPMAYADLWRGRLSIIENSAAERAIDDASRRWRSGPGQTPDFRPSLHNQIARSALARSLQSFLPGAYQRSPHDLFVSIGHSALEFELALAQFARSVVFLHDLIPISHPRFCRPGEAARHRRRVVNTLKFATSIIVNSRATETALRRFAADEALPVPPTLVAPLGVEIYDRPEDSVAMSDRPYCLIVGTIEPRKNHALLLDVWDVLKTRLAGDVPRLIIAGKRGWMVDDLVARLGAGPVNDVIEWRSDLSDAQVQRLVERAAIVLCPSEAEGFDLPFLEALAAGKPVIASDIDVHREFAPPGTILLDPSDTTAWANHVIKVLEHGPQDQHQAKNWRAPSWPEHFEIVGPLFGKPGH